MSGVSHASPISRWNATARSYRDGDKTLDTLVRAMVGEAGDSNAIVDLASGGRRWSYREFDALVGSISGTLHSMGVRSGDAVGVLANRSVNLVAAVHAVVRAGAAYVPLDPEYPPDRLAYMTSETGMKVILADPDLMPMDAALTAIPLDDGISSHSPFHAEVDPADPAYVIYTSGSTGRPKGVQNGHRGVVNRLLWMQETYPIGPGNVVLQKTPYSFDVSVWELFWPFMTGAALVIAAPGAHRDPSALIEAIVEQNVDTIHFVPSMLRLFLDHPIASSCRSLERVICSGEALTRDLTARFFEVLPTAELHNLYGPTEAAIDVTFYQCMPDDDDPVVPIGRPVANTTIHILDDAETECAVGEVGELHIGGVQVAHGYRGRPDLTAERFVAHPEHGRLYKTGDLARWLPSGTIEFLGRIDHQIKLRGQRIELGEIEATLGEHPDVLEAVITPIGEGESVRLWAHVMPRTAVTLDTSELRSYAADRLPAMMVPDRWVFHETLPLTTSGKADRGALSSGVTTGHGVTDSAGEDGTLEMHLLLLWRRILGRADLGLDDHVFDAGANSLDAARFVNDLQRQLEEFIYVVTVFVHPKVEAYAAFLRREYPDAVRRVFGASEIPHAVEAGDPLDGASLAAVSNAIPRYGGREHWEADPPNRPAAFILAPPRSGTTLLRVMLAGHPRLLAASELQLLGFGTLRSRRQAFSGADAVWLEGVLRMLMEIHGCDAAEAAAMMDHYEAQDMSCKDFYSVVQSDIGDRLLIDKSPAYASDIEVLRNAERGFHGARYIHLVRDPHAVSRSFESYHMDQILHLDRSRALPAGRRLGEAVWTISHRNILDFSSEVDSERIMRIQFEDLVTDPTGVMQSAAAFLGVDFVDAMADPYTDLHSRMVDGLHSESTPMGDTRLLERDHVDSSVATRWEDDAPSLGPDTLEVQQRLARADRPDRRAMADAARMRRRERGGGDR